MFPLFFSVLVLFSIVILFSQIQYIVSDETGTKQG